MKPTDISIERLPTGWTASKCDLIIATIGFEERARYIWQTNLIEASLKVAAAFSEQHVLQFDTNQSWFLEHSFEVTIVNDSQYSDWVRAQLNRAASTANKTSLHVVVDISSITRLRLAKLLTELRAFEPCEVLTDFVYSLAAYNPPQENSQPNVHVGPVTADFAGWWKEPDRPLSAIVGLGYEQDKAMGAVEYLQAQDVWLFQPVSAVKKYTAALQKANATLLGGTDERHLFSYRVHDPLECYATVRSLVNGLLVSNNVVLIPFGPKIFVLCCLLVAAGDQQIAVWRVSASAEESPVNRRGIGPAHGLRVRFGA